jgi:hypothetical protein
MITVAEGDIFPKCAKDKPHDALWIRVLHPEKENTSSSEDMELSS